MKSLMDKKARAISLRKTGQTYDEIGRQITISKSTLSGWLKDVELPRVAHVRVERRKAAARQLGWEARRRERVERTGRISALARDEAKTLLDDPFWVAGVVLYWAEGHKEKAWNTTALVTFTNMDSEAISLFCNWCRTFLDVHNEDFIFSLYIHDTHKRTVLEVKKWWAQKLSIQHEDITVYYKRSNPAHVRHNDAETYHGVFRVRVRKSVDMNRRIAGWTSALVSSLKRKNKLD